MEVDTLGLDYRCYNAWDNVPVGQRRHLDAKRLSEWLRGDDTSTANGELALDARELFELLQRLDRDAELAAYADHLARFRSTRVYTLGVAPGWYWPTAVALWMLAWLGGIVLL
ncbi:MAG: hypothetical protein JW993_13110, partial [Sedimentisphaerales bacterium]|nr:hypothetical protein [Sedimentisphaerales bacterium]